MEHSASGSFSNLGASFILTCVLAEVASAACPAQSVSLATTSSTTFETLLSQCHLGGRPGLCTFDTSVLTPHFFEMTDVH